MNSKIDNAPPTAATDLQRSPVPEQVAQSVGLPQGPSAAPGTEGRAQSAQVEELLSRAGLARTADGATMVRDVGPSKVVDAADAARAAMGELSGSASHQIAPAAPPKIEMTEALRVGAETFANNIDEVVSSVLFRNGATVDLTTGRPPENASAQQVFDYLFKSGQLFNTEAVNGERARAEAEAALAESRDGIARGAPLGRTQGGLTQAELVFRGAAIPKAPGGVPVAFDAAAGKLAIDPTITIDRLLTPENLDAVTQAALQMSASGAGIGKLDGAALGEGDIRRIAELSADVLLAAFLKLNITDPNNSVETHNKLHELASELRQQAIDEAQQKAKNAQEALKEAQAYAAVAQKIGMVVMVITIILSIVLAVLTLGAATPLIGAAIAGMSAATTAAIKLVAILLTLVMQVIQAVANHKAADKSLDAAQKQNDAERSRHRAEREQEIIEEEAAIIKTIMESKNQTVDAVIKMLNAMFATQAKVMSAGMSR